MNNIQTIEISKKMNSVVNSGWLRYSLGNWANLGLPILFFVFSLASFIWFWKETKKGVVPVKAMVVWLVFNIFYLISVIYVLITAILQIAGIPAPNVFSLIAYNIFGLELPGGLEWVFLWIFAIIGWLLAKSVHSSIRISELNDKIDELNEEVSFLAGKINKTADFDCVEITPRKETKKEIMKSLKNDIYINKIKAKAEKKSKKYNSNGVEK